MIYIIKNQFSDILNKNKIKYINIKTLHPKNLSLINNNSIIILKYTRSKFIEILEYILKQKFYNTKILLYLNSPAYDFLTTVRNVENYIQILCEKKRKYKKYIFYNVYTLTSPNYVIVNFLNKHINTFIKKDNMLTFPYLFSFNAKLSKKDYLSEYGINNTKKNITIMLSKKLYIDNKPKYLTCHNLFYNNLMNLRKNLSQDYNIFIRVHPQPEERRLPLSDEVKKSYFISKDYHFNEVMQYSDCIIIPMWTSICEQAYLTETPILAIDCDEPSWFQDRTHKLKINYKEYLYGQRVEFNDFIKNSNDKIKNILDWDKSKYKYNLNHFYFGDTKKYNMEEKNKIISEKLVNFIEKC